MIVRASIQNYTYLYFFFTSFGIFLYALFVMVTEWDSMVSFNLLSYPVDVDRFQLSILFKVAYLVLALGYYIAERLKLPLNQKATLIHTYITIGSVLINAIVMLINQFGHINPTYKLTEMLTVFCIAVALFAQPLFLWNIFQAISKRNTH